MHENNCVWQVAGAGIVIGPVEMFGIRGGKPKRFVDGEDRLAVASMEEDAGSYNGEDSGLY